jgi:hypothetical protein
LPKRKFLWAAPHQNLAFFFALGKVPPRRVLAIDSKTEKRPELRIIPGTYPREISRGPVSIVAAPKQSPPFPVDGVAFEEDTFLVLSADPVVRAPKESLMHVMTKVIETRPQTPGSVLVKGKRPLRLLAIVHDFNQDPSWREEWIASALDTILAEAETRRLKSIALPFLGTLHGSLEKQRFVGLLRDALERNPASHLERLWLVVPRGTSSKILDILESNSQG